MVIHFPMASERSPKDIRTSFWFDGSLMDFYILLSIRFSIIRSKINKHAFITKQLIISDGFLCSGIGHQINAIVIAETFVDVKDIITNARDIFKGDSYRIEMVYF